MTVSFRHRNYHYFPRDYELHADFQLYLYRVITITTFLRRKFHFVLFLITFTLIPIQAKETFPEKE